MSRGHGQTQRWVLDRLEDGPELIKDLALYYFAEKSEAAGRLAGNFQSALSSVRRAVNALEDERLVEVAWVDRGSRSCPAKGVRLLTWQDTLGT